MLVSDLHNASVPAPPDHPVAIQITTPEGVETTREPNDPNLGSEIYYKIRGNVKNHIRRRDLLRNIAQKFESREDNRSQIVILEGMGGRETSPFKYGSPA